MDSTQLDRTRGTRGEIAELIGSPSWDATRTLWMPGLVSAIHSNYCNTPALQVYHTWTCTNQCMTLAKYRDGLCVLWPRDGWHATLCVPDAKLQEMYGCLELCRRQAIADVTEHCGRFFPSLPHISPTDPPALGCHNACPTLYLILSKLQPLFTK